MGNPTWERPFRAQDWPPPSSWQSLRKAPPPFWKLGTLKWVGCWIGGKCRLDGSDGSDQISWNVKYSIWQGFILVIPEPSTVWKTLRKVAPKLILGQVLLFPLQQWLVLCTGRSDLSALQLLQWIRGWETENYRCKDRCIHRFTAYLL